MRSLAMVFALMMGVAAIAAMAGCAATALPTAQTNACPPGVPWVPDGYGNGKFIPGHCQGYAAQ